MNGKRCPACGLFMRKVPGWAGGWTWRCVKLVWVEYYGAWEHL